MPTAPNTQKTKQSEPAVPPEQSQDSSVTNSDTTPSSQKSAKDVQGLSQGQRNLILARYIVGKYVKEENIVWPRDIKIAYDLIKRFPEVGFWEGLQVKFKAPSLACLRTQNAVARLKLEHDKYIKDLNEQKTIFFVESKTFEIGEKVGDDYVSSSSKKKSIKEFCK